VPIDFPEDKSMRVSHEATYQALFVQGGGALRRELSACSCSARASRIVQPPCSFRYESVREGQSL
jgi:hypothetical protein